MVRADYSRLADLMADSCEQICDACVPFKNYQDWDLSYSVRGDTTARQRLDEALAEYKWRIAGV